MTTPYEYFSLPDFDDHEHVAFVTDPTVGLRAIIAIHSTTLGPAAGGCRMYRYDSDTAALTDALRLSQGMSRKNAAAGLDLGGGKAVIMLGPDQQPTEELFHAFGRAVDRLGGAYITAEDVGVTTADMEAVATQTAHVAGLASGRFASGNPSPVTARGVFDSMRIGAEVALERDSLRGLTVAVQGLGSVGYALAELIHAHGGHIKVTDINPARCQRAATELSAEVLPVADFHATDCDIFAPCALGGGLNEQTIPEISARLICGAANNQLATDADAQRLHEAGIVYLPDFLINAGGIGNAAAEIAQVPVHDFIEKWFPRFRTQVRDILTQALADNVSPHVLAVRIADARLHPQPATV